jgi:hypothetical protein
VSWEQARYVLEQGGAASAATHFGYRNSVTAMVDPEDLSALLGRTEVAWVDPDGHAVPPFVLDPDRPFAAAFRGINHRDNVEQIRVHDPMAGQWRILVEGTAVADGPQELALIASAGEGNRAPERLFEVGLEIPAELPADDYTAHTELTMHNGVRCTADCPFTVELPG